MQRLQVIQGSVIDLNDVKAITINGEMVGMRYYYYLNVRYKNGCGKSFSYGMHDEKERDEDYNRLIRG